MKMNFIVSQTTIGATEGALNRLINEAQNREEEYIVLAPETKTLFVERYLLDHTKNHAFSNIFVYSFARLLKRLQVSPIFPLSKEAGVMIIRNIIMELVDDLVCYKKTALTVGFAENIYETIQQLKSSGVSPEELSAAAKECSTALKIKLEDIALLYAEYQNYLSSELSDPSDKLTMLEALVSADRIKNSHVYVVGFDSLTKNMAGVIKEIAKNAKSLTVSAPFMHPSRANAHISDNEVLKKFEQIADELKIKYEPIVLSQKLSGDFAHINKSLFAYPIAQAQTKNQIKMFEANSVDCEARKVASLIKSDILDEKYRFKDICIYLANEELKPYVEDALDDYEIPYFSSNKYQYETHPLFYFIKSLFQAVRHNLDSEEILKLARSSFLELSDEAVDDFENYVLHYGINHNRFLKPFKATDDGLENAELVRKKVMETVADFARNYNENLTVSELVDEVFAFFDRFELEKKLENLKKTQKDHNDELFYRASEQSLQKATDVLKMLSQFLGKRKVKLDDLYTLLISGLEAADISLLPLSVDVVQIVSSPDGLYNVKCLYIMGASDGNFPKREQDLGLIQDGEILSLEQINKKKIEPTIKTINRRERYKAYELLTLPTEKVTISYCERSVSGEEEKTSAMLMSLCDLFIDGEKNIEIEKVASPYNEDTNSAVELAKSLGSIPVALTYLAESLSRMRSGADENISSLYFALKDKMDKSLVDMFESINAGEKEMKFEGAKELFFPKGRTSISELESYFSCPFKHFVDYGLKLKERKEASLKALDVGDILHAFAEKFVNKCLKEKDFDEDKASRSILKQVLVEKNYSEEDNIAVIKILSDEARRLARALKKQLGDTDFRPFGLEKWFGGDELQGIEVSSEPKIQIVGKIDRLDKTSDFYRIIDYKTGKLDSAPEDIYYGRKLQLAIYLSAMSKIKQSPAGVLYFPVHNTFDDGEEKAKDAYKMRGFLLNDMDAILSMDKTLSFENPKSHYINVTLKTGAENRAKNLYEPCANNYILSAQELESIRQYALAVSKVAVGEMLEGFYKPSPLKKGQSIPCEYCKYKSVCGVVSEQYKSVRILSLSDTKFYKGGKQWLGSGQSNN